MSFDILSFILDIIVLTVLGITIYYALRLSKSLNSFRSHRKELNNLMDKLSAHIDQAHEAIIKLKAGSQETAGDLKKLIRQGAEMADELELITRTGDSLAQRLERLAQQSARGVSAQSSRRAEEEAGEFTIQDPDFAAADHAFESQAERELYEAMQTRKAGGVR